MSAERRLIETDGANITTQPSIPIAEATSRGQVRWLLQSQRGWAQSERAAIYRTKPVELLAGDAIHTGTGGGLLNIRQAQSYLGGISRWTIHLAVKDKELSPTRL